MEHAQADAKANAKTKNKPANKNSTLTQLPADDENRGHKTPNKNMKQTKVVGRSIPIRKINSLKVQTQIELTMEQHSHG